MFLLYFCISSKRLFLLQLSLCPICLVVQTKMLIKYVRKVKTLNSNSLSSSFCRLLDIIKHFLLFWKVKNFWFSYVLLNSKIASLDLLRELLTDGQYDSTYSFRISSYALEINPYSLMIFLYDTSEIVQLGKSVKISSLAPLQLFFSKRSELHFIRFFFG